MRRGSSAIRDLGHADLVRQRIREGRTYTSIAEELRGKGCEVSPKSVGNFLAAERNAQEAIVRDVQREQAENLVPFATEALRTVVTQGLMRMGGGGDERYWSSYARTVAQAATALMRAADGTEQKQTSLDAVLEEAHRILRIRIQRTG